VGRLRPGPPPARAASGQGRLDGAAPSGADQSTPQNELDLSERCGSSAAQRAKASWTNGPNRSLPREPLHAGTVQRRCIKVIRQSDLAFRLRCKETQGVRRLNPLLRRFAEQGGADPGFLRRWATWSLLRAGGTGPKKADWAEKGKDNRPKSPQFWPSGPRGGLGRAAPPSSGRAGRGVGSAGRLR
jgi:hypothetical protein